MTGVSTQGDGTSALAETEHMAETEQMEEWVQRHVLLVAAEGQSVTLDRVGELVGAQAVTQAHLERLFDALEARGIEIVEQGAELAELLQRVLAAARDLRERGARPSPPAIAEQAGVTLREVRVALLFADVLQR